MNRIIDSLLAELSPEWIKQNTSTASSGIPPVVPDNGVPDVPMETPGWAPSIEEPEPDLLPDELPVPNPDENREPPKRANDGSEAPAHDLEKF